MAVEYPGYGIYAGEECDADGIVADAHVVVKYLVGVVGYGLGDVVLVGRSLGSGPACALAGCYGK